MPDHTVLHGLIINRKIYAKIMKVSTVKSSITEEKNDTEKFKHVLNSVWDTSVS
jgi:hypothetical protein